MKNLAHISLIMTIICLSHSVYGMEPEYENETAEMQSAYRDEMAKFMHEMDSKHDASTSQINDLNITSEKDYIPFEWNTNSNNQIKKVLSLFSESNIESKEDIEAIKLFIKSGEDINQKTWQGFTVLWLTSKKGHTESARLLIKAGAKVNQKVCDGSTPLYAATKENHTEVVQLLLNAGADVNLACCIGFFPLYVATEKICGDKIVIREDTTEIKELLLAAGANRSKMHNIEQ